MYVSTYLELYTTLLGWKLYDLSYAVLSELGITLIPFVILIVKKMTSDNSAKGDSSGITDELDTVISMIIAIVIWITCVIPWATVAPTNIRFQPTPTFGNLAPPVITATEDNSTYANTFSAVDLGNAEIPLWWGFVSQVSTGVAHAISDGLPKEPSLETMKVALTHDNINDPETRSQYKEFYAKCFKPASNKFHRYGAQDKLPATATTALNLYGAEDVNWPGSRVFRATPGFYATCNDPVSCGSSLTSRQPVGNVAQLSCADWWTSLSQKMLLEDGASSSRWADFRAWSGLSDEAIEDTRIKNLLANLNTNDIARPNEYGNPGWFSRAFNSAQNLLSTGTVAAQAFQQNAEKEILRQVIPMVKSVALLILAFVLPFLLVTSLYSIGGVITLTIVFFSLYFIHALLAVANWVDHFLISAVAQGYSWTDYLLSPVDIGQGRLLLGIITGSLYVAAPTIWFYGLVIVGSAAGSGANKLVNGSGGGGAAATGAASQQSKYVEQGVRSQSKSGGGK